MAELPNETCLNSWAGIKSHSNPLGLAAVMPTRRYKSLFELTPITSPSLLT